MDYAIEVKNLTYTYPNGFTALKNISFSIKKNEFVAIIGQNGAGKSTLLKNLVGLLTPTSGEICIDGVKTTSISVAKLSQKLGFVLQNPDRQLFADTVYDEIAFGPRNLKVSKAELEERVEEAIKMAGLQNICTEYPPALSAGERAKVVIASVAAMRPDIIILDEPTTGQDNRGCKQIMDIARAFHEMGHTIVVVTHNMSLVAKYAQRTLVFCKGQLLIDGSTREVFSKPDLIQKAYVVPPQITQIGQMMSGIQQTFLTVEEMRQYILADQKKQSSTRLPG